MTNEYQALIPRHHLIYKWYPDVGTLATATIELQLWMKTYCPTAQHTHQTHDPNYSNLLIFSNEDDLALAKLTWDLHNA
jgi:hypothetical protein